MLSVVGARPQFVKLGPIAAAFRARREIDHRIVHTGQHYDPALSDVFFADLGIEAPAAHLGVGSGTHGRQTGDMLAAMDQVLEDHRPDWVLVYGDTNSTLAGTLAAVKMHIPVAHLEAGLRSFNRRMPEEHNRVLTDHAADLLLAPTEVAMGHLVSEGLGARARLVGDVMTDICFATRDAVTNTKPTLPPGISPGQSYIVATIHRADNTDDAGRLAAIMDMLAGLEHPVVLLAHPRLKAKAEQFQIPLARPGVRVCESLPYPQMVATVRDALGVVTDSGGLQKEAFLLATPCVTIRTETEWVETLDDGWNTLDPDLTRVGELLARPRPSAAQRQPYGDGHAAERVVETIISAEVPR